MDRRERRIMVEYPWIWRGSCIWSVVGLDAATTFIEPWHKTLKYSVGYPKMFESLEATRVWYADFVYWYNDNHQHSGLAYATPIQARKGETKHLFFKRNETIREARQRNPLFWSTEKTMTYALPVVKAT